MKTKHFLKGLALVFGLCLLNPANAYHFPWDQGHDTTAPNEPENNDPEPPCSQNAKGSPVYLKTGQFVWTEQDVVLPGRPLLEFNRTYYSKDPRDGSFGKGWHGSCESMLLRTTDMQRVTSAEGETIASVPKYVLRLASGRRFEFTEQNGVISKPNGMYDYNVVRQTNGVLRLTQRDGSYKEYNQAGQVVAEADRNGNVVNHIYSNGRLTRTADTSGRYLAFTYDASGRVAGITDHTGRSWHYQYNTDGTLASVTDPMNGTKNYEYVAYKQANDGQTYYQLTRVIDETGKVTTQVTYSAGKVASYTEGANTFTYTRSGLQVTKRDSQNATWTFTLNEAGLYTSVKDPNGLTELFEYNADQQVTRYTDPAGTVTTNTYDNQNRLVQSAQGDTTTTWMYSGNNTWPSSTTSAAGATWQFQQDTKGNLTRVTNPAGNAIQYTWSASGDLVQITLPDGAVSRIVYNNVGLSTTFTDALNRVTRYEYDSVGNLTGVFNSVGDSTALQFDALQRITRLTDSLGSVTQYSYDEAGRTVSVTAANGAQATYTYDAYGRKNAYTHFDGGQETFTYRNDNLLLTYRNVAGQTVQHTYDMGKRLTQTTLPDDSFTYTYNIRGQITQARNSTGTITNVYDGRGRLTQESVNGEAVGYSYDAESRVTGMTALGETLGISYDSRGLMQRMTSGAGSIDYQYDANGRITRVTRPNGIGSVYNYDVAGELTSIDNLGMADAHFQYQYDDAGRVVGWQDGIAQKQFEYDTNGRLKHADYGNEVEDFNYDAVGNRIDADTRFDTANRLLEDHDFVYQYDAKGNRISKLSKSDGTYETFAYSARNQLVRYRKFATRQSTSSQVDVTYAYDAFGRRWYKQPVNGVRTSFIWQGSNLLAEKNGTQVQAYLGGLIKRDGQYYFPHFDLLQSARAISDASGQVVWAISQKAYGKMNSISGSFAFNGRFPGQYYDAESGLHYNYYRDYDPAAGRYLQSDPIGLAGGINTYAYVYGNPISAIDPLGLNCVAVGGNVTCVVPGGGPTVTFPRPPEWPDKIDPSGSNYHYYNIAVPLNGAKPACVMQGIVDKPTPGSPSPATPEGTSNNATPNGAQNFFDSIDYISSFGNDPGGYNNSPVNSYVLNNGTVVVNVTKPGHPLHPGYVARTVGNGKVNNQGEGVGFLQGPYSPVSGMINGVWNGQAGGIVNSCSCQ